jgi:hypothetical protein
MNRLFNYQTRVYLAAQLLIIFLLFGGSACRAVNSAHDNEASRAENRAAQESLNSSSAISAEENKKDSEPLSIDELAGRYEFNNHRDGKGGNVNFLTIKKSGSAEIDVFFEGTNFFMAGKAETFHEASAIGDLKVKGNTASGKLFEEGTEDACPVTLTFAAGKVTLKSSGCEINVSPDGVYKKTEKEADDVENSDADVSDEKAESEKDAEKQSSKNSAKPFIKYDDAGNPNAVINLMATTEERVGCEDKVLTFEGKVLALDNPDDVVYEFTLANGNRKRQKISLIVSESDNLSADDLREIVKIGANLTVNYIYCGNAAIATPVAIYKN